jgi:hypothetical protein
MMTKKNKCVERPWRIIQLNKFRDPNLLVGSPFESDTESALNHIFPDYLGIKCNC